MAKRGEWWEYCSNCSHRVECDVTYLITPNPGEVCLKCPNCGKREIVDITSQHRPE